MHQASETFPARMDAWSCVAAFVEEACAAAALEVQVGLRIRLIVEELFTNTVRHGHGRDSDQPVTLTITHRHGEVALTYEDTAPPYDPFSAPRPPDESAAVEQRPVGGLGLVLIVHMARDIRYAFSQGKNRISLIVDTP